MTLTYLLTCLLACLLTYLLTYLLTHLRPSLPVEHRPSTTPRHLTLFWAALVVPDQLVPCCLSSALVSPLQLLRGRPLFLFPCGFQVRAWRMVLDAGFLRVCPIQPHFLRSICLTTGSCPSRSHRSSFRKNDAYMEPKKKQTKQNKKTTTTTTTTKNNNNNSKRKQNKLNKQKTPQKKVKESSYHGREILVTARKELIGCYLRTGECVGSFTSSAGTCELVAREGL